MLVADPGGDDRPESGAEHTWQAWVACATILLGVNLRSTGPL